MGVPMSPPSEEVTEAEDYDVREDVLGLIGSSSIQDFDGDAIAWATWCRAIANAANAGEVGFVCELLESAGTPLAAGPDVRRVSTIR